mmetsp:Transcript_28958/g.53466  ORF Transcript_28958/g.53466 Transcript_28958/m.53466 type:complete len:173 (+) Transcript_28958:155-673(+)
MSEPDDSETAKVSARAVAQKAYKKEKKKRAKAKLAEEKKQDQERQSESVVTKETDAEEMQTAPAPTKSTWCRTFSCKKAIHRPVDIDKINELLEKRSEAKAEKNYAVSDSITLQLIDLEIVYDDNTREWHTRALLSVEQKRPKMEQAQKRVFANQGGPATKKQKKTKAGQKE